MSTRMIQRKGTYQQWFDINPRLNSGEIGFESDTGKFKIGDGSTLWNDLGYFVDENQIGIITQGYATEEYVDNAVNAVDIDLSAAAGANIDWNASTLQFDAVIPEVNAATPTTLGTVYGKTTDSNVVGNNTTALGQGALKTLTSGSNNTAIGYGALEYASSVSSNTAVGSQALQNNLSGLYNTVVGESAMFSLESGNSNVAIGLFAIGNAAFNTSANVAVGYQAGSSLSSGQNNIIIGYNAEPSDSTVNNEITLGNSNIKNFRIPGLDVIIDSNAAYLGNTVVNHLQELGQSPGGSYDVITFGNFVIYDLAAENNFSLNIRGNNTTSLLNMLWNANYGAAVTITFLVKNLSTGYYLTSLSIDGNIQTVKWKGGTAPNSGNANSIDAYTFTIVPNGTTQFTVLGFRDKFA